jgi:fermentation-respiration switch protein FrsA (DUF1100 family)
MSLVKEVWLGDYAEELCNAGYITLTFDYRGFGESGGEPRRRMVPQAQVEDVRNALTWLETRAEVDPTRLAVFGLSLGASVATAVAGTDSRVRAGIAVAGPGDFERVWRNFPGFESFYQKIVQARRAFVATGELSYIQVPRLLRSDPKTAALLEAEVGKYPTWDLGVTFESLYDLMSFKPENVCATISPGAMLWVLPGADELIGRMELLSMYAKARPPRKLLTLDGIEHAEIYNHGRGFDPIVQAAVEWLAEHLAPGRGGARGA